MVCDGGRQMGVNRRGLAADTYDFEVGLPLVGLLEVEALFVPIFYETN